ncbi:MAG: hypothetical protein WD003_02240 [Candidatus Paceibacterota bacterium]
MEKNLFIAIGFSLLLLTGAVLVKGGEQDTFGKNKEGSFYVSEGELSFFQEDSDGDGLKDWEEVLVGSDKNNPDTDGDGVNDYIQFGGDLSLYDGEEITKKYGIEESFFFQSESGNLTEKFAKSLFVSSLNISQGDNFQDEDEIISNLVHQLEKPDIAQYTRDDMTIAHNTTNDELRAFGNILATQLQANPAINVQEVLSLFETLALNSLPEFADKIQEQSVVFDGLAKDILTLSVPSESVGIFLQLVNSYKKTANSLTGMSRVHKDAILGKFSFDEYRNALGEMQQSLASLSLFFKNKGVEFKEHEAGYVWNTQ